MSSARSLRRRTARRVAATRSAPESSRARHAAPGVDARDRTRGRRTTGTRQARQGSRRSRSAARRGDRRARHADRRGRAAGHSGHRDQRRSARQRTPNYGETRRGPRDGTAVGATDPRGPRPLPADHHPARLTPTGCPKSPIDHAAQRHTLPARSDVDSPTRLERLVRRRLERALLDIEPRRRQGANGNRRLAGVGPVAGYQLRLLRRQPRLGGGSTQSSWSPATRLPPRWPSGATCACSLRGLSSRTRRRDACWSPPDGRPRALRPAGRRRGPGPCS